MMMTPRMGDERGRLDARGNHWITSTIGRLKPGITIAQARASVNALMAHLAEEYPPSNKGKSVMMASEAETSLNPMVRGGFVMFLQLMFGVMGFILLLACANVAGLLLARSSARRKEIGLRMALGANRGRLMRQMLAESLLLSLLAGAAGLLLNVWLTGLIQSFRPPSELPLHIEVSLNWPVLAFTFAITVVTGVLFGLTPALAATRTDLVSVLKESSPVQLAGASRLRRTLVVAQVAISLALLIGAVLVVRSLQNARHLDPGFNPDNQVVASLELGMQQYDEARARQFMRALRERLEACPEFRQSAFPTRSPSTCPAARSSFSRKAIRRRPDQSIRASITAPWTKVISTPWESGSCAAGDSAKATTSRRPP